MNVRLQHTTTLEMLRSLPLPVIQIIFMESSLIGESHNGRCSPTDPDRHPFVGLAKESDILRWN